MSRNLGGAEIIDPWATGEVAFPAGSVGEAAFTSDRGLAPLSGAHTHSAQRGDRATQTTGQITCYNHRTS